MTKYLVDYFQAHGRPGALEEVLAGAGETRGVDTLADESGWSSYAELRALLEAAAAELGGVSHLTMVAACAMESVSSPEFTAALQDLGSPTALYASIADASATLSTIIDMTAEEVGPSEWILANRFQDGFEAFPEYCAFGSGLISVPPMLFGLPPAEVVEEECQARGAPACRYRVSWTPQDDETRRWESMRFRAEVGEARLRAMQATAADIVSGGDLRDVLARIVEWTGRAVRATGYLLAVEATPLAGRWVHSEGLDRAQHEELVRRVADGTAGDDVRLCPVEIVSERARYGHLIAVSDSGRRLFPQELEVLHTHARLAAAALDSASAVHEARRQADTATALLELASSLSHLAGVREMADRVARAVPLVVDCDRASVVLMDVDAPVLRFVGMWGYPAAVEAELRAGAYPGYTPEMPDAVDLWDIREVEDADLRRYMAACGSAALARIPIYLNGVAAGAVIASVTDRPERLTGRPDMAERLRGVAAQAGTAIGNARLLDRIQHQALHDALTGLPNRALILDRAGQMLARARRQQRPVAALFVDLDDFKDINDTFGHDAGDALLRAVAGRFTSCLRGSDTVGRMGGDEFVVLADATSIEDGPQVLAERLHGVLRDPFYIEGPRPLSLFVSASIGIAVADRGPAEELLRMADIALYHAKATGRSCYSVFDPGMETEFVARVELELQLRSALDDQQFVLDYQPTFDLDERRITGAEALIRWQHPIRGLLGPAEFIPSLEETGLIDDVGRWVVMTACRQAKEWERAGHGLDMAVNLSARQLASGGLVDDVRDALELTGLDPSRLTLEITESGLMVDREVAAQRMAALQALGVRLAVDDFGTGYSSFAYLRAFPVEVLKIDRTFVKDAGTPEGQALLKVMLDLGRSLGLATVAEGVETEEQLAWLKRAGCGLAQGFHLARPMSPAAVLEVLESAVLSSR
ncbi:MAG TPA: EAL domain-containing protein [Acidimicrobiales bacterium]|nr:EAL domain-containing protein [Acidimicrobiales bacterium]